MSHLWTEAGTYALTRTTKPNEQTRTHHVLRVALVAWRAGYRLHAHMRDPQPLIDLKPL